MAQNNTFDQLDLILQAIEKGKSLEDSLKAYLPGATELEPLLRLVLTIKSLPKPKPRPEAFNEVLAKTEKVISPEPRLVRWLSNFSFRTPLIRIAAVVLFVVLLGWSSLALSSRSVPGEVWYPIKRASEKLQYTLAFKPERKALCHLTFADKRTKELAWLLKRKGQFNKELFNACLNEARSALQWAEPDCFKKTKYLVKELQRVNQNQMAVFLGILKGGCPESDNRVLKEAFQLCVEREYYLQYRLNPKLREECNPYNEAWDRYCCWR